MIEDPKKRVRRRRLKLTTLVDDGSLGREVAAALKGRHRPTRPPAGANPPRRVFLTAVGQTVDVEEGAVVLIGREDSCQLKLGDPYASRIHARVCLRRGRASLEDLGSRNPVLVNGEPVTDEATLHHGDVLMVGRTVITVTRQRHAPRTTPSEPPGWEDGGAFGQSEPTLGAGGILEILETASWEALRQGDVHAAEVGARRLLTSLRGGAGGPHWVHRALQLTLSLSSQVNDPAWVERTLTLFTDRQLLLDEVESREIARLLKKLGGHRSALTSYLSMAGTNAHQSLRDLDRS